MPRVPPVSKAATMNRRFLLAAALLVPTLVGCGATIPNTTVEDTPENREVVQFVEEYRRAVEDRDVGQLLQLASARYLDDNGTITGSDDLDYDSLREKLSGWRDRVLDVRYEIKYRRVSYDQSRIYVEFRYTASFRVTTPDGEDRWARRLGDHRLVLTREEPEAEGDTGPLRILAGM